MEILGVLLGFNIGIGIGTELVLASDRHKRDWPGRPESIIQYTRRKKEAADAKFESIRLKAHESIQ